MTALAGCVSAKVRLGLPAHKIVSLEDIGDVLESPEADERAQAVADKAVTLVRNEGNVFPLANPDNACVVVLAESRYSQQGRKLIEEIRRRAPKMRVNLLDAMMAKADLDQAAQSVSSCGSIVIAAYVTVGAYRGNVALAAIFQSSSIRLFRAMCRSA